MANEGNARRPAGERPARYDASLLTGDVAQVARRLLGAGVGAHSDRGRVVVRLTEVEAYGGQGEDAGSHAHRGPTPRTATMFGPAGRAYVYLSYGVHLCLNVVTGPVGQASAVLLRAGEVVEGLELARSRRPSARRDVELARGPGRLAAALGLRLEDDGADMLGGGTVTLLRLPDGATTPPAERARPMVAVGPRVGLSVATATPWRFWLAGEATVSPWRPGRRGGARG